MFKIPKTKRRLGDFEDRFEKGIWLGMTVQSGEHIIGTPEGVFRAGSVMRCAPDQRWSSELILGIVGSPAEPRPGSGSETIPTYAKQKTNSEIKQHRYEGVETPAPVARPVYIFKQDVIDHGPSPKCKACAVVARGENTTGYAHTASCRLRFEDLLRQAGSERLRRADARLDDQEWTPR